MKMEKLTIFKTRHKLETGAETETLTGEVMKMYTHPPEKLNQSFVKLKPMPKK